MPPVGWPIDVPIVEPFRTVTVFVRVAAPDEHDAVWRGVSVEVLLLSDDGFGDDDVSEGTGTAPVLFELCGDELDLEPGAFVDLFDELA